LPFQLTDTLFLKNKDTASIRSGIVLPDSLVNKVFGKGARVKFIPLWKIPGEAEEKYFIVKGQSNRIKAAFLLVFDIEHNLSASFPFLVPDNDATTMEVSSIDKAYSITRSVVRKLPENTTAEGRDVYAYDKASKSFVLVMTDPLDEKKGDLVNPIDTLAKSHKLAGDYSRDKRNIVSIRDGRKTNLLTVFIHIEKDNDCVGEIKGDALITSPTTAVYQQTGDPCVLQLNFMSSSVKLTELEGCGSRRGLGCLFEGTFTRKKPATVKPLKAKNKILTR
jgi:hypothetical protein